MPRNDTGFRTFTCGDTVAPFRLLKLDATGRVVHNGANENPVGSSLEKGGVVGDVILVALISKAGTVMVETGGAFSFAGDLDPRGMPAQAASDGKITQAASGQEAYAISEASGSGALVEVLFRNF